MQELVIISGKGGTGKTSLVGALASLGENQVLADCDVDAADLHLLMAPQVVEQGPFSGGKRARIDQDKCVACGTCAEVCRFGAVTSAPQGYSIDPIACEGCGVCSWFCPVEAIPFEPVVNGTWYRSQTRFGPLVHASLGVAEENSGKLVSLVRQKARAWAEEVGADWLLVDGSPGVGCPVIASITGADMVLVVTEPTPSGLHDLERVLQLCQHFAIPARVVVNKWDIYPQASRSLAAAAEAGGGSVVGWLSYDGVVTHAQRQGVAVPELGEGSWSAQVRMVWQALQEELKAAV